MSSRLRPKYVLIEKRNFIIKDTIIFSIDMIEVKYDCCKLSRYVSHTIYSVVISYDIQNNKQ